MQTISNEARSSLDLHFKTLDSFQDLAVNWDTYGAKPIARKSRSVARSILLQLSREFGFAEGTAFSPYVIVSVPDGGVGIEWRGPGGQLTIEIEESGEIGYLQIQGSADKPIYTEGDNLTVPDILRLIRNVFQSEA